MTAKETVLRWRRPAYVGAAFALAVIVFLIGRATAPGDAQDHDHDHDHASAAGEGDEQIYYCSMHPDQQSTDPDATCPICGMDLVPMPDDDHPEEADMPILRVGERAAALLGVEVAPAERRGAHSDLDLQGHVEADERRLTDVVARSDGFVERQYAAHEWQEVRRGQALASIYSPAVTAAARELLIIQRTGSGRPGGVSLESGKERLRRLGAPEAYIEEVLETGEVPRTYTLRSPASGVITAIDGREGHAMKEGERHIQIADLSSVWVQLQAYEHDVQGIEIGDPAAVSARAYPGEAFDGGVAFVDPAVDAERRTVRVRLEVENPDGRLKPGMFVRGRLGKPSDADSDDDVAEALDEAPLVIPRSAPLLTGRRAVVYVQQPSDEGFVYEGRDVELGGRMGDVYPVLSGLEEGELVVVRGAFRIDSELQIRGRPSMMTPGEFFAVGDDVDDPGEALRALDADAIPAAFASGTGAALEHYFELTSALADDDFERAHAAASRMGEEVAGIDASNLSAAAGEAWESVQLELTGPLAAMEQAGDLDGLREPLELLDEPLVILATLVEEAEGIEVYRGTCPMTPSGTGHWLQPDDEIANPYMGHEMLQCGSIEPVTP